MAVRKTTAVAAIACSCIIMYSCNSGQAVQQDSKVYESMTLKAENIELSETYPASIQERQDIAIYLEISGTISKVSVKEGQRVKKGQSLFVIDQVPYKAALQIAQAQAQEVTAQNNMTYTMVLSPADGVVGTLPYREGALVSPSIPAALTTVSDNSVMYVYFSLTENRLLSLTREHSMMDEALRSLPENSG